MSVTLADVVSGQLVDPGDFNDNNAALREKFDPSASGGGINAADMKVVNHHHSWSCYRDHAGGLVAGSGNALEFVFVTPFDHMTPAVFYVYLNNIFIWVDNITWAGGGFGATHHFSLEKQKFSTDPGGPWTAIAAYTDVSFTTADQYCEGSSTKVDGPEGSAGDDAKGFKLRMTYWVEGDDITSDIKINAQIVMMYEHKANP